MGQETRWPVDVEFLLTAQEDPQQGVKTDEMIFEGEGISYSDSYEFDVYGEDLTDINAEEDFFSQETETLIKISEEFAASLVTTILENF